MSDLGPRYRVLQQLRAVWELPMYGIPSLLGAPGLGLVTGRDEIAS